MTALAVPYRHSDTPDYWRTRMLNAARSLPCELHDDAALYSCHSRDDAFDALYRVARSAGLHPAEYRAGHYTAFIPGRLALIYDNTARWAVLCTVSANGRLATVDDVAVWGV